MSWGRRDENSFIRIGLFSSIASGFFPDVFLGLDTNKHASVRQDFAEGGPVPVGMFVHAHSVCASVCARAASLARRSRFQPDFLEVSLARALNCIAVRRGDFDEWSKVGVRGDGQERKQS